MPTTSTHHGALRSGGRGEEGATVHAHHGATVHASRGAYLVPFCEMSSVLDVRVMCARVLRSCSQVACAPPPGRITRSGGLSPEVRCERRL